MRWRGEGSHGLVVSVGCENGSREGVTEYGNFRMWSTTGNSAECARPVVRVLRRRGEKHVGCEVPGKNSAEVIQNAGRRSSYPKTHGQHGSSAGEGWLFGGKVGGKKIFYLAPRFCVLVIK
jgi:hypothetical protein